MNLPEPVASQPSTEQFRGGTARISGSLVPELVFDLDGSDGIFFEHHTLLWKDASLNIELKKLPGGIKRKIAGLDFFLTMSRGPGRIAFSHDAPGKIIDHHLEPGQTLLVREHHFLAATDNLEYTFERVKGVRSMLFGGSGFFVDKFSASKGTASVWVMGNGDVYRGDPRPGRADRHRGRQLALPRSVGADGGGDDGAQDGALRRRWQAHLEPVHRAGPGRHPDDVPQPGSAGRGRRRIGHGQGGGDRRDHRRVGGRGVTLAV